MNESSERKEVISRVLAELASKEAGVQGQSDPGFDVEQAVCACCCAEVMGTGRTAC